VTTRLDVDWIKCKAHGLCYELFPERIRPDDWGYPIIDDGPVPPHLEPLARRAADACPTLALLLSVERTARP
jgi:ferredoxin